MPTMKLSSWMGHPNGARDEKKELMGTPSA
jgi:hypothetical protein